MKFYNWQIILFFIFSSSLNNINYSQSINGNNFRIEHVRSFSKMGDFLEEGFFNKISKIIFGNNDLILNTPVSIFATDNDNLFILDQGLLNIVTVDLASEKFEIINSNLSFPSLISICMYKNGNYLFTDSKLNQIYILENEEHIRLLNDSLKLLKPTGIGYIASKNEIWVSETGNHSIVILDEEGKLKRRIGKRGIEKSEFNFPTNIWVDQSEKIFIVDALNFRIQIFDKSGSFISSFGQQGDATGYFARPKSVATDSYGNIYVVDALFHTIQIFDCKGNYLHNFGSQGRRDEAFWLPNGIYIDKNNRIYIADSYNSRIQIFQLTVN